MTKLTFTQAFKRAYWQESKYILKHIKNYNNGKDANWSDFRKLWLIGLVEHIKSKVSPNSARTYCAILKSLLNDYSDEVNIPCRDYADILSLKKVGVLNVYLTNEEIQRLIYYVPENKVEHTIRNQFVIACLTGARHSDVIKLDVSNIHGSEIVYLAQKTQSVVKTVNSPIVEDFIKLRMNEIYPDKVYNDTIREICKKVGINQRVKVVRAGQTEVGEKWQFISSHTSRRSFCTNLYNYTKDILLVSKLAGHSEISVTQRYICSDDKANQSVQNYFAQFQTEEKLYI